MVVDTPRATMASQLKKGTVQLNVLQRKEKETVNIRRHGKAQSSQTCRERVDRVTEGILILSDPNELIWMPLYYKFITQTGTVQMEIIQITHRLLQVSTAGRKWAMTQYNSHCIFSKMLSTIQKHGSKMFQFDLKCFYL